MVDPLLLAAFFFVAAVLYASVGHAGASAYLAIMGLTGVAPDVARPTALALNIVVATFVTYRFWRGGHISCAIPGAVPARLDPARLPRRLPAGGARALQAAGRDRAALRGGRHGADGPTRRPGRDRPCRAHGACPPGGRHRCRHRAGVGPDRDRWRHLPEPGAAVRGLGGDASRVRHGRARSSSATRSPAWPATSPASPRCPAPCRSGWSPWSLGAVIGSEIGNRRGRIVQLRAALSVVLVIAGLKLIFIG